MTHADSDLRVDRATLREHLRHEYGGHVGLNPEDEGGLCGSIVRRILDAQDCGAITLPDDIEIDAIADEDSVVVAVRELRPDPASPAYRRQIASYGIQTAHLPTDDLGFAACCATIEACLARAHLLLPSLRLLQAAERSAAPELVYVVDASASDAFMEGEAPAPDQPTAVRFGPLEGYVELTYDKLRCGPDGDCIGVYNADAGCWELDGLLFSDLVISVVPRHEAHSGSGVWGTGQPATMRLPTVRY